MAQLYKAQEFSSLAGVTIKALYHYERVGLLEPARSASGYRMYSAHDLERLEQIVALKFLGIPLREMGESWRILTEETRETVGFAERPLRR